MIKQSRNLISYELGLILAVFEVNKRQRLLTKLQKNPFHYVLAIISILGLERLLGRFLHILKFGMEAVCDLF